MPSAVSQHFTGMEHLLTTRLCKHFTSSFPPRASKPQSLLWSITLHLGCCDFPCGEPLSYRPCVVNRTSALHRLRGLGFSCLSQLLSHQFASHSHKEGGEIICKAAPHQPWFPAALRKPFCPTATITACWVGRAPWRAARCTAQQC